MVGFNVAIGLYAGLTVAQAAGLSTWTSWEPSPDVSSSRWPAKSTEAPQPNQPQSMGSDRSTWTQWTGPPSSGTTAPSTTTTSSVSVWTKTCFKPVPSESRYFSLTSATTQRPSTVTCPSIQTSATPNADTSKANAVRDAFVASYDQYAKYCYGQDSLVTKNNTCKNDFGGWGATIVDGLDTAIIMNLTDIVTAGLQHVAQIDFTVSSSNDPVSAFETTIRYLGGLLSSYDLLKSGYVSAGTYDESLVGKLLTQAVSLASQLNYRFGTPTGLPVASLFWNNKTLADSSFVDDINNQTYNASNVATCGTFILEYYRLSDLTGDPSYREIADRAEEYLINLGPEYKPVYGNLVGSQVDLDAGNYLTYDFGWQAGIDSFWEYLLKVIVYDPKANPAYVKFWTDAAAATQQNIYVSPYNRPDLHYITQGDDCGVKEYSQDDYACFAGGNFLLGYRFLNDDSLENMGLGVTEGCFHTYNTSVTGLGPQQWAWFYEAGKTYNESWSTNQTYIQQAAERGIFLLDPQYNSFPESIESIWYAWRETGNPEYRDWNWQIFEALQASSDPAQGIVYQGVTNVDIPKSFQIELPSFYFAEVLKYLYLTFTDSNVISLDKWVFNTEAHPFLIGGGCIGGN